MVAWIHSKISWFLQQTCCKVKTPTKKLSLNNRTLIIYKKLRQLLSRDNINCSTRKIQYFNVWLAKNKPSKNHLERHILPTFPFNTFPHMTQQIYFICLSLTTTPSTNPSMKKPRTNPTKTRIGSPHIEHTILLFQEFILLRNKS